MSEDISLAAHPYRPAARFAASVCGVVVVLTIAWFTWAAVARHRLLRDIETISGRGEPILPTDFPNPPLADADNGAVAWGEAMSAVSTTVYCPANSNLEYHNYPTYPPAWWAAARASEAANGKVFPLADTAATRPTARWLAGPTKLPIANAMRAMPYNEARNVANVLADSALLAHFGDHDDDRCVSRLSDVIALADAVDQQPSEISRLVAIGIRMLADDRIFVVAPDLDVGAPDSDRRRHVRALVDRLLATPPMAQRIAPLMAERASQVSDLSDSGSKYVPLAPMTELSAARFLRQFATDIAASRATNAPSAGSIYAASLPPPAAPSGTMVAVLGQPALVSRCFDDFSSLGTPRYTAVDWLDRSCSRAAGVALAIRLYRVDHDGNWPTDLSALVPGELAAVPTDPSIGDTSPFGYLVRRNGRPDGGDRPMLAIGLAHFDPATVALPPGPSFDRPQHWIDLTRWDAPPIPPPSTAPTTVPGM